MTLVTGTAIAETAFPRFRGRRFLFDQASAIVEAFDQDAGEHVDYSVDLTHVINADNDPDALDEVITAAWADTSDDAFPVSSVGYGKYGVVAWVYGGLDGVQYDLTVTARTNLGRFLTFKAEIRVKGNYGTSTVARFTPPILGDPLTDPDQNYFIDVLGRYLAPSYVDATGTLIPGYGVP